MIFGYIRRSILLGFLKTIFLPGHVPLVVKQVLGIHGKQSGCFTRFETRPFFCQKMPFFQVSQFHRFFGLSSDKKTDFKSVSFGLSTAFFSWDEKFQLWNYRRPIKLAIRFNSTASSLFLDSSTNRARAIKALSLNLRFPCLSYKTLFSIK
jgi:hypothetical protein